MVSRSTTLPLARTRSRVAGWAWQVAGDTLSIMMIAIPQARTNRLGLEVMGSPISCVAQHCTSDLHSCTRPPAQPHPVHSITRMPPFIGTGHAGGAARGPALASRRSTRTSNHCANAPVAYVLVASHCGSSSAAAVPIRNGRAAPTILDGLFEC